MKLKSNIVFGLLTILTVQPLLAWENFYSCQCGSPSSGTVVGWVVSSSGPPSNCCTAPVIGGPAGGFVETWAPDEGNTYTLIGQSFMDGNDAMSICCH